MREANRSFETLMMIFQKNVKKMAYRVLYGNNRMTSAAITLFSLWLRHIGLVREELKERRALYADVSDAKWLLTPDVCRSFQEELGVALKKLGIREAVMEEIFIYVRKELDLILELPEYGILRSSFGPHGQRIFFTPKAWSESQEEG